VSSFASKALGISSLAPASLNFKNILDEETMPSEPILFVTTPGADPSQELKEFAIQEVGADNFKQVNATTFFLFQLNI
jgi:dynein heavy chain 2, cytosolic